MIRRRDERRPAGDRRGVRVAVVLGVLDGQDGPPGDITGIRAEVALGAEHRHGRVVHRDREQREET